MMLVLYPSELQRMRKGWPSEPAIAQHRTVITDRLSILVEIRWKEFEETATVTDAWIDVRANDNLPWTRLGNFPLKLISVAIDG